MTHPYMGPQLFLSFQYGTPLSSPNPTSSTAWSTAVLLHDAPEMMPPWYGPSAPAAIDTCAQKGNKEGGKKKQGEKRVKTGLGS